MYGTTANTMATSVATQSTPAIYHTIGSQNLPSDNARDYFMFNDRDYMSVIELLMVPACAPGLFTKQFAEMPPPISPSYQGVQALAYPIPTTLAAAPTIPPTATYTTTPTIMGPLRSYAANPAGTNPMAAGTPTAPVQFQGWGLGGGGSTNASQPEPSPWPQDVTAGTPWNFPTQLTANGPPHPFPYLNDEFFYTGFSEPTPPPATGVASTTQGWVSGEAVPNATAVPPTTVNFRSAANANYIGGPGGAGYHKMLDFFEVPSPAFGAIGEVATGTNYDWARQDLKPGLLNLNLIIDEEVFLGLMGPSHYGVNNHGQNGTLNQGQIGMPGSTSYGSAVPPKIITQGAEANAPTGFGNGYPMPNVGIWDPNGFTDPLDGNTYPYTA